MKNKDKRNNHDKKGGNNPNYNDKPATNKDFLSIGSIQGLEGAGSVAMTNKAGLFTPGHVAFEFNGGSSDIDSTLPCVMVVRWTPVIGDLPILGSGPLPPWIGDNSILSSSFFKLYNTIRAANSSISSYVPSDVFKAMYACTSLGMLMGYARQVLSLELNLAASPINNALVDGLCQAYGIDVSSRATIANDIAKFNNIINNLEAVRMPKMFPLFERYVELASTIFTDDSLIKKSQMIVFAPRQYYEWITDPSDTNVGQLIGKGFPTTIASLLPVLDDLVRKYTTDDDFNNIMAEIRKAFSDAELYHFTKLELSSSEVPAIYDSTILRDALKNAMLVGQIDSSSGYVDIMENATTGRLHYESATLSRGIGCKPITIAADDGLYDIHYPFNGHHQSSVMLYSHEDQASADVVRQLCMWKVSIQYNSDDDKNYVRDFGTELINDITVYCADGTPGGFSATLGNITNTIFVGGQNDDTPADVVLYYTNVFRAITKLSVMSCSPVLDIVYSACDDDDVDDCLVNGVVVEFDVDNRSPISRDALRRIHEANITYLITPRG